MIYRAEIIATDPKKPVVVYLIPQKDIVEAAIDATKMLNAQKAEKKLIDKEGEKKLRVGKVEEIDGKEI